MNKVGFEIIKKVSSTGVCKEGNAFNVCVTTQGYTQYVVAEK